MDTFCFSVIGWPVPFSVNRSLETDLRHFPLQTTTYHWTDMGRELFGTYIGANQPLFEWCVVMCWSFTFIIINCKLMQQDCKGGDWNNITSGFVFLLPSYNKWWNCGDLWWISGITMSKKSRNIAETGGRPAHGSPSLPEAIGHCLYQQCHGAKGGWRKGANGTVKMWVDLPFPKQRLRK